MGLDMYLMKKKKGVKINYEEESYESWKSRQLMYWRKANHIHKWFVDNVQDNNDDCGYYTVSKSKLIELRDTCNKILNSVKLIPTGRTYKVWDINLGKEVDEPEMIVSDDLLCEELLPTQDGFFFGSTNYDDYYYESVKYTRDGINKLLTELDFDEYDVEYSSSW